MTASFLLSSTSSFLTPTLPSLSRGGKLQGRQSPGPDSRLAGASYPVIYPGQTHPRFVSTVKACLSDGWWLIELFACTYFRRTGHVVYTPMNGLWRCIFARCWFWFQNGCWLHEIMKILLSSPVSSVLLKIQQLWFVEILTCFVDFIVYQAYMKPQEAPFCWMPT